MYSSGRNNIIIGDDSWPWWILYGSQKSEETMLSKIQAESSRAGHGLLEDEKLMVIGLGTASLFAAEALNFYGKLLLLDHKEFSVYNPVRQLATTQHIGKMKPFAVQQILADRLPGCSEQTENGLYSTILKLGYEVSAGMLRLKADDKESIRRFEAMLDMFRPTIVFIGTGQMNDDNYIAAGICRNRGIRHVATAAFPLATHYKHIVVDGKNGPCYSCLHGRLVIDTQGGPELSEEQRQMFYGFGNYEERTQPATIFETWPSVHSALHLCVSLSAGEQWLKTRIRKKETCFVGGNISTRKEDGSYLYGVNFPGQVVAYSTDQLIGMSETECCLDCGRKYHVKKWNRLC